MNCQQYQELLQQRLDGEAAPRGAELDEHIRGCAGCRELDAVAGLLERGLKLGSAPRPPESLSGRIVGRVLADHRKSLRRRRQLVAVCALAASLLLALLVERNWPRPGIEPVPQPIAKQPEPTPEREVTLNQQVGEAGSALAALWSRTADETITAGKVLLPEGVPAPMVEAPTIEPPALPLREATQGVTGSLEPVASSARRAVNMFLRDLPPMFVEEKP